ncbi:pitrilysin family protein [Myxococcus sp. MISCRS1]|uniref:M16 family metallopeptidase n=1 Tax=unclassified Myxococcus TaxID=2648731 RepID=UPI001CBA99CA|nr:MULTISPECIES: pitrilysin family protein [unclassified Myxococcus]MBZ4410890.1 insulinase family protein [Myxococcus sp. XM-1-1-1]MCY0997160.1 pitrilysin family protein [Myxococcus sp. MISCRS1]BDT32825.1 insulinase family protein [Myxococcus sp. MH1]
MRRLLPLLLLLLGTALPALAQPQAASQAFPYTLKTEKLANGLTVVRVPYPSQGIVSYVTVVRVGSRNEVEAGKTGFAHFFEHMMFKGTKRHPEGERERILGTFGFDDNAFTTDDITLYYSYGPSAGLPFLIDIEADRFRNLEYSEPSFRTEALAVLGEYHKNAAAPYLKMEEALNAAAFTKHTYRHTTLGFYDDIKAMPEAYQYSRDFFERWYTPDNTMLFIVGDFDDDQVMKLVREHYGPWDRKTASIQVPKEPPQTQPRTAHVDWPQPTQPRLVLAWHTPAASANTSDSALQTVLVAYLVGPTSPAYKQLVLDKQLVEAIGSDYVEHRDPHLFSLTATLKNEKDYDRVRLALLQEVSRLAAGKVDAARVKAIQDNARYGALMALQTPRDVGIQLGWYAGILGTPDGLQRQLANLAKVTPAQLSEFAKRHLKATNLTLLSLTPKVSDAGGTK